MMTLQLVIDNSKVMNKNNVPTCRKNCELFDPLTSKCGINHKIQPDDPFVAARCGDMIYKDEHDNSYYELSSELDFFLEEDEMEIEYEEEALFSELMGNTFNSSDSTYPIIPDYPSNRDDAIWYVSPCQTFGCWIINKSKKRFFTINGKDTLKEGWNKKVYKSPYPLHNHDSSLSLSSRMAWYVDEDGYGQYVLLGNGKISMISSPRPLNWKG